MLTRLISRLRDERGMTLMETLVAMVTGLAVTGALFAILEFSVHQTSRISQYAQATQVSRGAMTRIVDELHSACLSTGFYPVEKGSTPTKLIFWNGYSEGAEVPSTWTEKGGASEKATEGARLDTIQWDEAAKVLYDRVQPSEGTEASGRYKPGKQTSVKLAENVTQAEIVNAKGATETLPIFRYYEYATTPATATTEAASTLKEIPLATNTTELTEAQAKEVASVQVSFRTTPKGKEAKLGSKAESTEAADATSQTTFAFSAPNSESTIEAGPCE